MYPVLLEDDDETKSVSRLHVDRSMPPTLTLSMQKRFNASKTKYDSTPLTDFTQVLADISRALPIHLLPGSNDPTGSTLPQKALPRPMFGKELNSKADSAFVCETNPAWIGAGPCEYAGRIMQRRRDGSDAHIS